MFSVTRRIKMVLCIHVLKKNHKNVFSADEEESKVAIIAEEVSKKQRDCEADLLKAEPALLAAQEALNTLNKANLTELKSFGSPPGAVTNVTAAVMVLLAPNGKVAKDRSWKAAKVRRYGYKNTCALPSRINEAVPQTPDHDDDDEGRVISER